MQVDVTMIESDDVAKALAEEVAKCTIKKLVIGASSRGMFTRYIHDVVIMLAALKNRMFEQLYLANFHEYLVMPVSWTNNF